MGFFIACCSVWAKAACWKPYFDLNVLTFTYLDLDGDLWHRHSFHIFLYKHNCQFVQNGEQKKDSPTLAKWIIVYTINYSNQLSQLYRTWYIHTSTYSVLEYIIRNLGTQHFKLFFQAIFSISLIHSSSKECSYL